MHQKEVLLIVGVLVILFLFFGGLAKPKQINNEVSGNAIGPIYCSGVCMQTPDWLTTYPGSPSPQSKPGGAVYPDPEFF